MCAKELRDRLHAADPGLNIIPARGHRPPSQPLNNWEAAAGENCKRCGREYFRGREGYCYDCWEKVEEEKVPVTDKTGITSWLPMNILNQITHPSRKNP